MEKLAAAETEVEELKNKQEDLEYYLENANGKVEKLDRYLCEAYQKLHTLEEGKVTVEGGAEGVSKKKVWVDSNLLSLLYYPLLQPVPRKLPECTSPSYHTLGTHYHNII